MRHLFRHYNQAAMRTYTKSRGAIHELHYTNTNRRVSQRNAVTIEFDKDHFKTSAWAEPLFPHEPSLQVGGPLERPKAGRRC
jgi:hypothetical protein